MIPAVRAIVGRGRATGRVVALCARSAAPPPPLLWASVANARVLARWQSGGSKKKKAAQQGSAAQQAAPAGQGRAGASRTAGDSSGSGGSAPATSRTGGGVEGDIVFSVRGLGKTLPGGRVLFSNVSLAFQRGAKIGLLGLNGSGKSSLMRILSGKDTEYDGEVWKADGLRVGYLEQEPRLDGAKSVHDNIMDGLREKTDLLAR